MIFWHIQCIMGRTWATGLLIAGKKLSSSVIIDIDKVDVCQKGWNKTPFIYFAITGSPMLIKTRHCGWNIVSSFISYHVIDAVINFGRRKIYDNYWFVKMTNKTDNWTHFFPFNILPMTLFSFILKYKKMF